MHQPGPVEPLEKKHKDGASTTVAKERFDNIHIGNDIGMVDYTATVPGGQQVHTISRQNRI